ncbi:MAG: SAM-dependent DNA methyltransferase [Acidimicrobiia bacterium]|nr:SAM-dependent DNA methyltransferase [Acidimicrobiia bacterium]MYG57263.1 SAM-dependent DNA methyltransferase [Acidimicrobiia bacterium]MYJ32349.1 SAM-dependent DNA methyltransferase [Acidimicrobiia bacterium]
MGDAGTRSFAGSESADFEAALNVRLAQLLKEEGIDVVRTEKQQPGSAQKRFDIEAKVGGLVIAIEAEIDSRRGALADARKRLREHELGEAVAHEAVAVSYPGGLQVETFDDSTVLEWAVLPSEQFASGRPPDLARAVRLMPEQRGDPEAVARSLDDALTQACEEMTPNQMLELAEELDLPVQQTVKGKTRDTTRAAAKRGLLAVTAAAMFHSRLDDHLRDLRPEVDARTGLPYDGRWPPDKLAVCLQRDDPVGALHDAWQMILAVDYRPIFEAACRALMAPSRDEGWTSAVRRVAQTALSAAAAPSSGSHDLIGRIFHRLLDSARYDGSFYTSTSAAVLLAGLAIQPENLPDDLSEFRVIDPACGTGTLLMAAAERIRDLRPATEREADAQALIEDVIWGLDVNTTACHMAATTLGLMSPSTAFRKMNIHMMPLEAGNRGQVDETRVGSLELLETDKRLFVGWSAGRQVDTEVEVEARHNSYDLVIMNPPYARDSLRHDQFSDAEERQLKRREKHLMAGTAARGESGSTAFCVLGEHLARLSGGAVASVLPLSAAGDPSGRGVRRLLAEWFHVEWVIASHDPNRYCFSENTTISEMLIVARRHSESVPSRRPPTKFVCLRQNSDRATDALATAEALHRGELDESVGSISEWPAHVMTKGSWRPLGLTSPFLVEVAESISNSELFPATTLDSTARVGPAGQRIRDVFTKHEIADTAGRRALWHNDTDSVRFLAASSDVYIHAKQGEREQRLAESYWEQRTSLLFCDKARLNTAKVLAVYVPEQTLGSRWIPVHLEDASKQRAYSVYFNSTLGVASAVACAAPNILSRVNFSLDTIRNLPVPVLTDEQANALAGVFDARSDAELLNLADAAVDSVRIALDEAVAETLGVPPDTIAQARSELCREPSVQGR